MLKPEKMSDIKSGRSKKSEWIRQNYPEFYDFLTESMPSDLSFKEKLYWYYNGISEHPVCPVCGKKTAFINNSRGYSKHCSFKCTQTDAEVRDKQISTSKDRYGTDFRQIIISKIKKTKKDRYGSECYNNSEKAKMTCIQKYGVDNPMKNTTIVEKAIKTNLERYGAKNFISSEYCDREEVQKKIETTNIERYGVSRATMSDEVKEKMKNTNLEKYGVEWACQRAEAHNSRNSLSKPNQFISSILDEMGISYEREFYLNGYTYDFKIGDVLLEINPSATHNINFNPFDKRKRLDKNYHKHKTLNANVRGYECIHIWSWDDPKEVLENAFSSKKSIGARECSIKTVSKEDAKRFLIENHLQGDCNKKKVSIGLYKDDELVQLLVMGSSRYNSKYEWEILRLATRRDLNIKGGASRLYKYFENEYSPSSVISYCDLSKFSGRVYEAMGFTSDREPKPSCHWYNLKTGHHILDSSVRAKGADKILKTNYGKNTDNNAIMLENGYVQVFDCGQKRFYKNYETDAEDTV